ncbi:MAG TPA: ribosome recycling factor [Armatimonadetes bacterium]|nr:ribosome recycling factor [Armatimonadota bacterium]
MDEVLLDAEERMEKSVEVTRREFATVRTGRASPALVENIRVDYYGTPTPLYQLATITVPEPRLLVISPWDKTQIQAVERALAKADLGLMPHSDGNIIRIPIPELTEERRRELVKVIGRKAEDGRVAIRNIRREANERLRKMQKAKEISEDECERALEEVQKLTDEYIEKIEELYEAKREELMEV